MCFPNGARSLCSHTSSASTWAQQDHNSSKRSSFEPSQWPQLTNTTPSPDSPLPWSSFDRHYDETWDSDLDSENGTSADEPHPLQCVNTSVQPFESESTEAVGRSSSAASKGGACTNAANPSNPSTVLLPDRDLHRFSCAEAICPSCSRRLAELACDPVWIDDARSRIRGAALAVVEAQQASAELSARAESSARAAEDNLGARRNSGSFQREDRQILNFRSPESSGRWWNWDAKKTGARDGDDMALSSGSEFIDSSFSHPSPRNNSSARDFQRSATTGSAYLESVAVTNQPQSIRRTKTSSSHDEAGDAGLGVRRQGIVGMVRYVFMRSPVSS